jgi:galactokinase
VLANSLVEAKKQAGARDVFNERVASYDLGLLMLRRNFPEHAEKLQHLRDVNPERLGAAPQAIYRMIRSLPERATREDVRQLARPGGLLADCAAQVERILRTHAEPKNGYGIRQVCMYGVSECIRSPRVKELLRRGDIAGFGEIIVLSHDGDRVTRRVGGKRVPVDNRLSDAQIEGLIADLDSCEPARARRAALWRQPGGYGVSTPQQDTLVDIACGVPGVAGAGRVGAGLGGAVVILVKEEQAAAVVAALTAGYYEPNNLEPACEGVRPVGGSGVLIPK